MTALTVHIQTETKFYYQLLPSAFKGPESLLYYSWHCFTHADKIANDLCGDKRESVRKYVKISITVGGYLGGVVALPITLCSAPFTLVADIVIGVAEIAFCYYHGLEKQELLMIAHRKLVVSPCQHVTYCIGVLAGLLVANQILTKGNLWNLGFKVNLVVGLILWPVGYMFGQMAVGSLPKSINHHCFNIFINGGAGETDGTKWTDAGFGGLSSRQRFIPNQGPKSSYAGNQKTEGDQWRAYLQGEIKEIEQLNVRLYDATVNKAYLSFKNRLLAQSTPRALLELPSGFAAEELRKRYRSLSIVLHPDKNPSNKDEATVLVRVLNRANENLRH
ncbi:MAG TPA: J domain-containing protein [Rhabdochlamydiaceae bacterium]|nr:J domain-containing protein [Rhabdochlamydiaceae bacterium]